MSVMAVTFPILPGKTPQWRSWMKELNGPRHEEFAASRSRAGVHERTFLQQTPAGDVVIVTLEGKDPQRSFEMMTSGLMSSPAGSSSRHARSTVSTSAPRSTDRPPAS